MYEFYRERPGPGVEDRRGGRHFPLVEPRVELYVSPKYSKWGVKPHRLHSHFLTLSNPPEPLAVLALFPPPDLRQTRTICNRNVSPLREGGL